MFENLRKPAKKPGARYRKEATRRQQTLTKPHGSLGVLEQVAIDLCGLQGTAHPQIERIHISVFAGDHGVAARGVSAFPQNVTAAMVANFVAGGAAISVLARSLDATLEIVDTGTMHDGPPMHGVIDGRIAVGTRDFTSTAAMSAQQCGQALTLGHEAATRARHGQSELFIGGDMGIANTTSATALACALLDAPPHEIAGPGTGLDAAGVRHKAAVVAEALQLHREALDDPAEVLRRLGGFEIAALTGAFIGCARVGVTALVDGFISSAAALLAVRINPTIRPWLLFTHLSAEPGHRALLEALEARPLLDLGLRLGEGSGAAVAAPLLRLACLLHNEMATFEQARVPDGT